MTSILPVNREAKIRAEYCSCFSSFRSHLPIRQPVGFHIAAEARCRYLVPLAVLGVWLVGAVYGLVGLPEEGSILKVVPVFFEPEDLGGDFPIGISGLGLFGFKGVNAFAVVV